MTVVVVGNPKPASRTRQAAELVAERLTGAPPAAVIELAELGPALLGWGDPAVDAAKQVVRDAGLVIVASPTYKATYTGLLKLFLDQFGAGELHGTTAVALMLGGSAAPRPGGGVHPQAGAVRDRLQLPDAGALPARLGLGGEPRARHVGRAGPRRAAPARLTLPAARPSDGVEQRSLGQPLSVSWAESTVSTSVGGR